MEAAQQVHGVGEVAARVAAGRFEQGIEIRVTSAPLARDARELGFGDADRFAVTGRLIAIPLPSFMLQAKPVPLGPNARA